MLNEQTISSERALFQSLEAEKNTLKTENERLYQRITTLEHLVEDQHRTQTMLQEKARMLSDLLDISNDWIWEVDTSATYTYASPNVSIFLGYEPDDLLGKTPFDLMTPDEAQRVAALFGPIAEAQQPFRGLENLHVHKDGRLVTVETSGVPLFDQEGCFRGYRGIDRDITERKQAEQQQMALQQQLIAAQQATISELSAPLLPLSDTIVALPLIGTIDSQRAQQIMETLLEGIAHYQAEITIIDITGVQMVDTQVAQALLRTAQAVTLLGARVILTGIQPQIAQTLVHLGIDLSTIVTRSTLQAGIGYAMNSRPGA